MTPYVLIIITAVYGGINVHSVDFNSHEACEAAKSIVLDRANIIPRNNALRSADCLPKSLPQAPVR